MEIQIKTVLILRYEDVYKRQVFGLVGLNGSGKSTMLKLVSGIYKPTSGTIRVDGVLAPLIELGAGFDMNLTARENVYLNGSVMGYSKKFLQEKFDEIIDFAELRDFVDVPLKNYSSGMVARLGFAIATVIEPDILICDEILAVGDFQFQQKCEERINPVSYTHLDVYKRQACAFAAMPQKHKLARLYTLAKYRLWKGGLVRKIGQCLYS